MKQFSSFAKRLSNTGITELMHDLGEANKSKDPKICMLGGGNPALIPEVINTLTKEAKSLIDSSYFESSVAYYSSPQGEGTFISALCDFLNHHFQWGISTKNIALTNGSQSSFFYLFNLLAGDMPDGSHKKILFPLSPEYIGYRDLGLSDNMFFSKKPSIEYSDNKQFKYHIDFDALEITDDIAAICISRPTNPTGNVITDKELERLDLLAKQHQIPLIIDNAYGLPFPGAIYTESNTKLHWHENVILGMSLSKLGLPGVRTGIIIANETIIDHISNLNGTLCLAPNNMGAGLAKRLIESGDILTLRDQHIQPFYQQKMQAALTLAQNIFQSHHVYIHKPEGAFFLWLWFPDLTVSTKTLYQRLKARKVFIIPGEDFFIGIEPYWEHQYQCIRINYAVNEEKLREGLCIIAEEIEKLVASC